MMTTTMKTAMMMQLQMIHNWNRMILGSSGESDDSAWSDSYNGGGNL
jgi:hypothetical protein